MEPAWSRHDPPQLTSAAYRDSSHGYGHLRPLFDAMAGPPEDSPEHADLREQLVTGRLPARERRILVLRFYGNLTQTEIADRVGLSQMHVSRLLSKTLRTLREGITQP